MEHECGHHAHRDEDECKICDGRGGWGRGGREDPADDREAECDQEHVKEVDAVRDIRNEAHGRGAHDAVEKCARGEVLRGCRADECDAAGRDDAAFHPEQNERRNARGSEQQAAAAACIGQKHAGPRADQKKENARRQDGRVIKMHPRPVAREGAEEMVAEKIDRECGGQRDERTRAEQRHHQRCDEVELRLEAERPRGAEDPQRIARREPVQEGEMQRNRVRRSAGVGVVLPRRRGEVCLRGIEQAEEIRVEDRVEQHCGVECGGDAEEAPDVEWHRDFRGGIAAIVQHEAHEEAGCEDEQIHRKLALGHHEDLAARDVHEMRDGHPDARAGADQIQRGIMRDITRRVDFCEFGEWCAHRRADCGGAGAGRAIRISTGRTAP